MSRLSLSWRIRRKASFGIFEKQFRDAVHIASAIVAKCAIVYTTDARLLDLNGKTSRRLTIPDIRLPEFLTQPELPL